MIAPGSALRPNHLIAESPELRSPPLVYRRLMEVLNHPRGGAGDVANVISQDMALTARLLKLVNSAFYSFPRKIETVSQAVSVVGTSQVRDLSLATSVADAFKNLPSDLIDVDAFWRHSLACGVAARAIAGLRSETNVERFFVAGILHDLGRLVLIMRAPDEARLVMQRAQERGALLFETEREVIGFDHGRVGGALMEHWTMPDSLREAVRFHHEPAKAERFPVEAATVHVADIIANGLQLGGSGERFVPPMSASAWASLGVDPLMIPFAVDQIDREYAASLHFLGLEGEN